MATESIDVDYSKYDFPIYTKKIIIRDECWIATDVFIAPGVTVESGSVVGARSSVYKNLPSNKICIGNPAEIIRDRIYPQ